VTCLWECVRLVPEAAHWTLLFHTGKMTLAVQAQETSKIPWKLHKYANEYSKNQEHNIVHHDIWPISFGKKKVELNWIAGKRAKSWHSNAASAQLPIQCSPLILFYPQSYKHKGSGPLWRWRHGRQLTAAILSLFPLARLSFLLCSLLFLLFAVEFYYLHVFF
jgi:hypothetical protein